MKGSVKDYMEEGNYSVYVHINKKDNNKCYVGISKNPKKRWNNGLGYKEQYKFYNAIKKYGWDSFKHIILMQNLTLEQAWQKEKEYIKKYNSIEDGYNVSEGGQIVVTEEMRKKGYITKKLKNSGLTIFSTKNANISKRYESVTEASKETGISEHWFYLYYKKEVDDLYDFKIVFDIEDDEDWLSLNNLEKIFFPEREEERKKQLEEEKRMLEKIKKEELRKKEVKHKEAVELAKQIVKEQNELKKQKFSESIFK